MVVCVLEGPFVTRRGEVRPPERTVAVALVEREVAGRDRTERLGREFTAIRLEADLVAIEHRNLEQVDHGQPARVARLRRDCEHEQRIARHAARAHVDAHGRDRQQQTLAPDVRRRTFEGTMIELQRADTVATHACHVATTMQRFAVDRATEWRGQRDSLGDDVFGELGLVAIDGHVRTRHAQAQQARGIAQSRGELATALDGKFGVGVCRHHAGDVGASHPRVGDDLEIVIGGDEFRDGAIDILRERPSGVVLEGTRPREQLHGERMARRLGFDRQLGEPDEDAPGRVGDEHGTRGVEREGCGSDVRTQAVPQPIVQLAQYQEARREGGPSRIVLLQVGQTVKKSLVTKKLRLSHALSPLGPGRTSLTGGARDWPPAYPKSRQANPYAEGEFATFWCDFTTLPPFL